MFVVGMRKFHRPAFGLMFYHLVLSYIGLFYLYILLNSTAICAQDLANNNANNQVASPDSGGNVQSESTALDVPLQNRQGQLVNVTIPSTTVAVTGPTTVNINVNGTTAAFSATPPTTAATIVTVATTTLLTTPASTLPGGAATVLTTTGRPGTGTNPASTTQPGVVTVGTASVSSVLPGGAGASVTPTTISAGITTAPGSNVAGSGNTAATTGPLPAAVGGGSVATTPTTTRVTFPSGNANIPITTPPTLLPGSAALTTLPTTSRPVGLPGSGGISNQFVSTVQPANNPVFQNPSASPLISSTAAPGVQLATTVRPIVTPQGNQPNNQLPSGNGNPLNNPTPSGNQPSGQFQSGGQSVTPSSIPNQPSNQLPSGGQQPNGNLPGGSVPTVTQFTNQPHSGGQFFNTIPTSTFPTGNQPNNQFPSSGGQSNNNLPGIQSNNQQPSNGQFPAAVPAGTQPNGQFPSGGQSSNNNQNNIPPGNQPNLQWPGSQVNNNSPTNQNPGSQSNNQFPTNNNFPNNQPNGQIPQGGQSGNNSPTNQIPGSQANNQFPPNNSFQNNQPNGQAPQGNQGGNNSPTNQIPGSQSNSQLPASNNFQNNQPNGQLPQGGQSSNTSPTNQNPGPQFNNQLQPNNNFQNNGQPNGQSPFVSQFGNTPSNNQTQVGIQPNGQTPSGGQSSNGVPTNQNQANNQISPGGQSGTNFPNNQISMNGQSPSGGQPVNTFPSNQNQGGNQPSNQFVSGGQFANNFPSNQNNLPGSQNNSFQTNWPNGQQIPQGQFQEESTPSMGNINQPISGPGSDGQFSGQIPQNAGNNQPTNPNSAEPTIPSQPSGNGNQQAPTAFTQFPGMQEPTTQAPGNSGEPNGNAPGQPQIQQNGGNIAPAPSNGQTVPVSTFFTTIMQLIGEEETSTPLPSTAVTGPSVAPVVTTAASTGTTSTRPSINVEISINLGGPNKANSTNISNASISVPTGNNGPPAPAAPSSPSVTTLPPTPLTTPMPAVPPASIQVPGGTGTGSSGTQVLCFSIPNELIAQLLSAAAGLGISSITLPKSESPQAPPKESPIPLPSPQTPPPRQPAGPRITGEGGTIGNANGNAGAIPNVGMQNPGPSAGMQNPGVLPPAINPAPPALPPANPPLVISATTALPPPVYATLGPYGPGSYGGFPAVAQATTQAVPVPAPPNGPMVRVEGGLVAPSPSNANPFPVLQQPQQSETVNNPAGIMPMVTQPPVAPPATMPAMRAPITLAPVYPAPVANYATGNSGYGYPYAVRPQSAYAAAPPAVPVRMSASSISFPAYIPNQSGSGYVPAMVQPVPFYSFAPATENRMGSNIAASRQNGISQALLLKNGNDTGFSGRALDGFNTENMLSAPAGPSASDVALQEICRNDFVPDATTLTNDGIFHIFSGAKVYKIRRSTADTTNSSAVQLQLLHEAWPGLDRGGAVAKVTAAATRTDGTTFLFADGNYWKFDHTYQIASDSPKSIEAGFPGINRFDSVYQDHLSGDMNFIDGGSYTSYNHKRFPPYRGPFDLNVNEETGQLPTGVRIDGAFTEGADVYFVMGRPSMVYRLRVVSRPAWIGPRRSNVDVSRKLELIPQYPKPFRSLLPCS